MSKNLRKFAILPIICLFLSVVGCSNGNSDARVYAFQMGKSTGSSPSYFRVALTLNNTITINLPSSSSAEIESSSSTIESSSVSSTSSSLDDSELEDSSIDALDYSRSFSFMYVSKFPSSSSSGDSFDSTSSSSSESSSILSSTSISLDPMYASIIIDGGFNFTGLFAEDPSNNLYFQLIIGNAILPASVFHIFLQAQIEEDHVNITLPVSFEDAYKAIVGAGKFETVTIALNKE